MQSLNIPHYKFHHRDQFDAPQPMPRPSPHLYPLRLRPIPKNRQVWLIPNINDQPRSHPIRIYIRDPLRQEIIPGGPYAIISRVRSGGVLCTVCTPQIVNEKYKLGVVFAGGFVVGEGRCKTVL